MIKKIAPDKWKHFFVGIGMGVFLQCFFLILFGLSILSASTWAFAFAVAISYGFELFSLLTGKGHYEVVDAVASVIGSLLGIGGVSLIYWAG